MFSPSSSQVPAQPHLRPHSTPISKPAPGPPPPPCIFPPAGPLPPAQARPTHGFLQWAAVSSHRGCTSTAPQYSSWGASSRAPCQGCESLSQSDPFTMRLLLPPSPSPSDLVFSPASAWPPRSLLPEAPVAGGLLQEASFAGTGSGDRNGRG